MKSPLTHLIIAFLMLVSLLAGYGVWYTALSNKSSQVATLQGQITAASLAINRAVSTRSAIAEIADDEAVIRGYFVPETAIVSFISDLEARALAQEAVVSVLSVSTGGSKTEPALLLSLKVTGTFDAIMRTVGAIEYAPYAISVSSLSVGQNTQDGWQASLSLSVGSLAVEATAASSSKKSNIIP